MAFMEGPARDRRRGTAPTDSELLQFLVESTGDLNSSLELATVFRKVAERVRSVVDCHLFCVMLWNQRSRLLEHSFSLCEGEPISQVGGFPLGTGISGRAAKLRRPVRVNDVLEDPDYVRYRNPEVAIRSELAVPLVVKDRLIGVIDLESTEPGAFTGQHEQILVALASHVATALENARLYERVRAGERRLEEDLSTAREIQKGLLPTAGPRLDGLEIGSAYLPARTLGGDFYDFLTIGDTHLALAIGDVAGKGTPAALLGSLTVGILRGQIVERRSQPTEMLARMNDQLLGSGIENRFVAMAYGVLDRRSSRLSLANGGFTHPYLFRNGAARTIPLNGLPLGILPLSDYDEVELDLRRGDVIAFCSDGLQESINGEGEPFGTADLGDVLGTLAAASAQQIADGILRAGTAYAGEHEEHPDDRSVVVLKVR
jgi:sigma-B regulation protein RsbU (phosphoserine phosphatase)